MRTLRIVRTAVAVVLYVTAARAAPNTWTGAGDWFVDVGNWSGGLPGPGSNVLIASGSVILTNDTSQLGSFTMTNGTFTFSGPDAVVRATNVWVFGGTVQHITNSATTTNGVGEWPVDGRVKFICTNFFLGSGGTINVDGRGWVGISNNIFCGPGTPSADSRMGAGYGGMGNNGNNDGPGLIYGSASAPDQPGSGGRQTETTASGVNGSGGGVVRIDSAGGTVTINGTITANGYAISPGYVGGGSGCGIWITCWTFAGTNGTIRANAGIPPALSNGGGGGRIAIHYDTAVQPVTVTVTVSRANGDIGTIYLSDTRLLRENLNYIEGQILGPWIFWGPTNLTVSNKSVRFINDSFTLAVSNNLTIVGTNALLEMGGGSVMLHECFLSRSAYMDGSGGNYLGYFQYSRATSTLTCGGNIVLTNSGRMRIYGGPTNVVGANGALVNVKGDVILNNGSWIHPVSNPTNGGSALFKMQNLIIDTNAGFNANQVGYGGGGGSRGPGYGPGAGTNDATWGSGGGYGGIGGTRTAIPGGITYGSSNTPVEPGSGGGRMGVNTTPASSGGSGGGLIRLEVGQALDLDGTLMANGRGSVPASQGGTGAGGGINVRCRFLTGAGLMEANGGSGYRGGSGGGGRIAIASLYHGGFTGSTSVDPGTNQPGQGGHGATGTVAWVQLSFPGNVISVR